MQNRKVGFSGLRWFWVGLYFCGWVVASSCARVDSKGQLIPETKTTANRYAAENSYWPMISLYSGSQGSIGVRPKIGNEKHDAVYDISWTYGNVYSDIANMASALIASACKPGYGTPNFLVYSCVSADGRDPKELGDFEISSLHAEAALARGAQLSADSEEFSQKENLTKTGLRGSFSDFNLDHLKKQSLWTSSVGRQFRLRYSPRDTQTSLDLCMSFPGVNLAPDNPLSTVRVSEGGRELTRFGAHPTIGGVSFNASKSCAQNSYSWSDLTSQGLGTNLAQLSALQFDHKVLQPVQILSDPLELDSPLVLDIFHLLNLPSDAEPSELELARIKSGEWTTELIKDYAGENTTEQFAKLVHYLIAKNKAPFRMEDLQTELKDQCRVLKLSQNSRYDQMMSQFCDQGLDNLQFLSLPPDSDPAQELKGCYSGFASVFDRTDEQGKPQWWTSECQMSFNFAIHVADGNDVDQAEIHFLLYNLVTQASIPPAWRIHMQKLGIDLWTLQLLLKKWDEEGRTSIDETDWSEAPQKVEEIRQKFLSGHFLL